MFQTAIALAASAGGKITVNTKVPSVRDKISHPAPVVNIEEKPPKVDTGQRHPPATHHISHPPPHVSAYLVVLIYFVDIFYEFQPMLAIIV